MSIDWQTLAVAGLTTASGLGGGSIAGWWNLRSTRESNAQALRIRSADLAADAAARADDAAERHTNAVRADIMAAHVAFTSGLQRAMSLLATSQLEIQMHHGAKIVGEAQTQVIECSAPLETLDVILPADAADAARTLYVHVSTFVHERMVYLTRGASARVEAPDLAAADLRYGELRGAYTALVRRELGR